MSLNKLFKSFSDESRIRLLLLLEQQELTVAELAEITQLAQPRVSTHLSMLKKNALVICRKQGVSSYYRLNIDLFVKEHPHFIEMVNTHYHDNPVINEDRKRLHRVLSKQAKFNNWFDDVAGDMERHYSPGRTWESTARSLARLMSLGDVLDIGSGDGALAALMSPQTRSYTCIDYSSKLIEAAKKRLSNAKNIHYVIADMHDLMLKKQFDNILMLQVLTYSKDPEKAIEQAFKVCRHGGKLLISTLDKHQHKEAIEVYGHHNYGFAADELSNICRQAGFSQINANITSQEQKKPHFKILTVEAIK